MPQRRAERNKFAAQSNAAVGNHRAHSEGFVAFLQDVFRDRHGEVIKPRETDADRRDKGILRPPLGKGLGRVIKRCQRGVVLVGGDGQRGAQTAIHAAHRGVEGTRVFVDGERQCRRIVFQVARAGRVTADEPGDVEARGFVGPREHRVVVAQEMADGKIAAQIGERAANHQVAVGLARDGLHVARRVETEGLDQAGKLVIGRVHEARVERAAYEQACHSHAARAVVILKHAAEQRLVVRLQKNRVHRIIKAGADVVILVEEAAAQDPHNRVPVAGVEAGEGPAHEQLVVRLHRQREDCIVHAQPRIEGRVERTVVEQASHAVARRAVEARKISADINRPPRHDRQHRGPIEPKRAGKARALVHDNGDVRGGAGTIGH